MRTLPDNPNLDHLRRQAKDLLAGLRDSDPGVSLADAQTSLARQYGFHTWADLKAEVDRLRGRADTADESLARELAARFALGEVTGPMRSMSRPDEVGRRWSLETDRGHWAPRTVDDVYPATDGEENTRFQEAAARAGVLLPAPVRSTTGAPIEKIGGHQWRVYRWLHSGPPLAAPVSAAITRDVGVTLATLHSLRFQVDEICPWNATRLSSTSWRSLVEAAHDRPWAQTLAEAVPTLTDLESIGDGAPAGDPVLCHNNVSPGNVRLGEGGRLVLTGWEHASGLPPEWELAQTLATWAVDPGGGVNVLGARALVAGYRARAGTAPALTLDTFRGAAIGVLNYVSGEIGEALHARGEEERRYADRNVRHLLTHLKPRAIYAEIVAALE